MEKPTFAIFVIDDDEADRIHVKRNLKNNMFFEASVVEAADFRSAEASLRVIQYDCILLDFILPDSDGMSSLDELHSLPNFDTPVIVLTGVENEKTGLNAIRRGAQDYLLKEELSRNILARTIYYAIERKKLHRDLLSAHARIKALQNILPICAGCKKIREDDGSWHQLESYLSNHSNVKFSHGYCPDCADDYYDELISYFERRQDQGPGP